MIKRTYDRPNYRIRLPESLSNREAKEAMLKKTVENCLDIIHSCNIRIAATLVFTINTRAQNLWGQCRIEDRKGYCQIEIADKLMNEAVPEIAREDTILHEICHTVLDGWTHTGNWKEAADIINQKFGYHITRTANPTRFGLPNDFFEKNARHKLHCVKCGCRYDRMRASEMTAHPENYRCSVCGGNIVRDSDEEAKMLRAAASKQKEKRKAKKEKKEKGENDKLNNIMEQR